MDLSEKHLRREGEHHVRKAVHHRTMAAAIKKAVGAVDKAAKSDLESVDMEGLSELLETFIEGHAAMADEHENFAEACAKSAEAHAEAEKTVGAEFGKMAPTALEKCVQQTFLKMFGDRVMPTNISVVAPNRPGLVAVPRGGQRPIPEAPATSLEFAKLFSAEDGETLRQ